MFWKTFDGLFETKLWKITEVVLFIFLFICLVELLFVFQYSIDLTLIFADRSSSHLHDYLDSALFNGTVSIIIFSFLAILKIVDMIRARYVTQHYRSLASTMIRFSDGQISERFTKCSVNEVNRLGAAFNNMADSLQSLIEELRRSEKQRKEITAHLAHDLAGPLTAISGYSERLRSNSESLDNPRRQDYYEIIKNNIKTLSRLIAELSDLSKLDIDEFPLHKEKFSLRVLSNDIISRYAMEAEKRNIHLSIEENSSDGMVYADMHMIERALSNLIENATYYTPANGKVSVNCSESEGKVILKVIDNGSGIPSEDLEFIFERFYRVAKDRSRRSGGSGLGLALVKKIIDLHKGSILVESEAGKGTAFSIILPKE